MITALNGVNNVATQFTLMQNYHYPFNPTTLITYYLPSNAFVSLKVYDELAGM